MEKEANKSGLVRPVKFLAELKNRFRNQNKSSDPTSKSPTKLSENPILASLRATNEKTESYKKPVFQEITGLRNAVRPVLKSTISASDNFEKRKQLGRPNKASASKEFLALKNSIEKQLVNKFNSIVGKEGQGPVKPATSFTPFNRVEIMKTDLAPKQTSKSMENLKPASEQVFKSDTSSSISSFSSCSSSKAPHLDLKKNEVQSTFRLVHAKLIDIEFKNELERLFDSKQSQLNRSTKSLETKPEIQAVSSATSLKSNRIILRETLRPAQSHLELLSSNWPSLYSSSSSSSSSSIPTLSLSSSEYSTSLLNNPISSLSSSSLSMPKKLPVKLTQDVATLKSGDTMLFWRYPSSLLSKPDVNDHVYKDAQTQTRARTISNRRGKRKKRFSSSRSLSDIDDRILRYEDLFKSDSANSKQKGNNEPIDINLLSDAANTSLLVKMTLDSENSALFNINSNLIQCKLNECALLNTDTLDDLTDFPNAYDMINTANHHRPTFYENHGYLYYENQAGLRDKINSLGMSVNYPPTIMYNGGHINSYTPPMVRSNMVLGTMSNVKILAKFDDKYRRFQQDFFHGIYVGEQRHETTMRQLTLGQDETLRDAENISDLESEVEQQWNEINTEDEETNNNMRSANEIEVRRIIVKKKILVGGERTSQRMPSMFDINSRGDDVGIEHCDDRQVDNECSNGEATSNKKDSRNSRRDNRNQNNSLNYVDESDDDQKKDMMDSDYYHQYQYNKNNNNNHPRSFYYYDYYHRSTERDINEIECKNNKKDQISQLLMFSERRDPIDLEKMFYFNNNYYHRRRRKRETSRSVWTSSSRRGDQYERNSLKFLKCGDTSSSVMRIKNSYDQRSDIERDNSHYHPPTPHHCRHNNNHCINNNNNYCNVLDRPILNWNNKTRNQQNSSSLPSSLLFRMSSMEQVVESATAVNTHTATSASRIKDNRLRVHSVDSLEMNEDHNAASAQDETGVLPTIGNDNDDDELTVECSHFTIPTGHPDYDLDVNVNVTKIGDESELGDQKGLIYRDDEMIPEIQIDLECKLGGSKGGQKSSPIQITIPKISSAIEKFCKMGSQADSGSPNVAVEVSGSSAAKKPAANGGAGSKFNDETIIKQRARESLKFWKEEEEKRKSENVSTYSNANNSVSNASNNNYASNFNSNTNNTPAAAAKSNMSSSSSTSNTGVNLSEISTTVTNLSQAETNHKHNLIASSASGDNNSTITATLGGSKRVKDRINIFESKSQQQSAAASTSVFSRFGKKSVTSDSTKSMSLDASKSTQSIQPSSETTSSYESAKPSFKGGIQSRIDSFEKKIETAASTSANPLQNKSDVMDARRDHQKMFSEYDDDDDEDEIKYEEVEFKYEETIVKPKTSSYQTVEPSPATDSKTKIPMSASSKTNRDYDNDDEFNYDKPNIMRSVENLDDKTCFVGANSEPAIDAKKSQVIVNSSSNLRDHEKCSSSQHIIIEQPILKSETNLNQSGEVLGDNRRPTSSSSSEIEEVEIIIDLNTKDHKQIKSQPAIDQEDQEIAEYRNKIISETLKNIVMHVVPTTRKAYVDDIVNGIRSLMNPEDLARVASPLDLPENVLRFVHKRYNNLLLEEQYANGSNTNLPSMIKDALGSTTTAVAKASSMNGSQVHVECDDSKTDATGVLPVKITVTMSPKKSAAQDRIVLEKTDSTADLTTEVTVVKEVRKEMLSPANLVADLLDDNSNIHSNLLMSSIVNDEIMKVDEETLYIVEKRKQSSQSSDPDSSATCSIQHPQVVSQPTSSTNTANQPASSSNNNTQTTTTHFVEKEIRKNFELKPKESPAVTPHNHHHVTKTITTTILPNNHQPPVVTKSPKTPQYSLTAKTAKIVVNNNNNTTQEKVVETKRPVQNTSAQKQQPSPSVVEEPSSSRLARLLADLQVSIEKINFVNDINDYQLHFFTGYIRNNANKKPNSDISLLVMLFDKQNDENFRFNLEKSYQKSIIETHLSMTATPASNKNQRSINLIARLNVFFVNDIDLATTAEYAQCELNDLIEKSKFNKFSLIKTFNNMVNKSESSSNNAKLPIGKYFVCVRYKHVMHTGDSSLNEILFKEIGEVEKESLVDLSLLPLAIRAQFKHIIDMWGRGEDNEFCSSLLNDGVDETGVNSLPELNMIALDSHLVQMEINKRRDEMIRDGIVANSDRPAEVQSLLTRNMFAEIPDLDRIMKKIELDLASYYICERVSDLRKQSDLSENGSSQLNEDDLVKLNKIDALASYKCVQKYRELICELVFGLKSAKKPTNSLNKFFLIDNGFHFKCVIPNVDLFEQPELTEEAKTTQQQVNSSPADSHQKQPATSVIENIHKRQNYIFNKDLMNVLNNNDSTSKRKHAHGNQKTNEKVPQQKSSASSAKKQSNSDLNSSLPLLDLNYDHLPSFSESTATNNHHTLPSKSSQKRAKLANDKNHRSQTGSKSMTENYNERVAVNNKQQTHGMIVRGLFDPESTVDGEQTANNMSYGQLETLDVYSVKEARDRIIVQEIDKMFASIRDHQSACFKARGETGGYQRPKKYSTWSYSSGKRHVKAKVMELPFAEDLTQLAKKVGGLETSRASGKPSSFFATDDDTVNYDEDLTSVEKVFVRIDDYLNQSISHLLQRSYSVDYLNMSTGPRTRIKYVKIPSDMTKSMIIQHSQQQSIIDKSMLPNGMNYSQFSESLFDATGANSTLPAGISTGNEVSGDYRVAPYDLRYWSILKLLEEERQSNNGQFITYFDELYENTGQWKNPEAIIKQVLASPDTKKKQYNPSQAQSINEDLKQFMSKENLEREIEKMKKTTKMKRSHQPPAHPSINRSVNNPNYSSILNVTDLRGKNYILYDQNMAKKPPPPPLVNKKVPPPAVKQSYQSSSSGSTMIGGNNYNKQSVIVQHIQPGGTASSSTSSSLIIKEKKTSKEKSRQIPSEVHHVQQYHHESYHKHHHTENKRIVKSVMNNNGHGGPSVLSNLETLMMPESLGLNMAEQFRRN